MFVGISVSYMFFCAGLTNSSLGIFCYNREWGTYTFFLIYVLACGNTSRIGWYIFSHSWVIYRCRLSIWQW